MLLEFLITIICVLASVGLHMSALRYLWRFVLRWQNDKIRRWGTAVLVLACMFAHSIEIAIFAGGFAVIAPIDDLGWQQLHWATDGRLEIWYYSASFYTSLGSSNPSTPGFRLLGGLEALTGLILITWTASFLYLVMSRTWEHHKPEVG